jgi:hypothetical protein
VSTFAIISFTNLTSSEEETPLTLLQNFIADLEDILIPQQPQSSSWTFAAKDLCDHLFAADSISCTFASFSFSTISSQSGFRESAVVSQAPKVNTYSHHNIMGFTLLKVAEF